MASMLKSMFKTSSGSSSSTRSKKRSSSEISSSLTPEQINMWVKASKNENNLNRTVTIHGSPNPFVLRRITDTGFGEKKITMKDILNKPTDKNVDFGYRIPEGIILVESVSDGVMFANGQTDVEILIHRSIPHHLTGKFKTITNDERYTVYPHKGMDDRFEYAVPITITARNQDDEEKNEYQMAWSLGVDENNKDGSVTHDYYKYTPYKMEGNDGLWDDDQIEKRWWWDQEGPLALLRNTHIYFPGDITYNKILAWDDAKEFNVFKMFPYNNQTNNKLYKQFIHESLYNNALEEGVDTEEITAKINNDEQFYMKYGEDYGAYTFGNKHRPEIEVLEIDKKINKDTHFRDKKGNIKDITTRELIDAFVKIYKPTKENPMILYMNSCIPDIKARNIKDGDAFMRDQRAKIREIFKTVISKQPNKKDILRSLKQEEEGNERTNKWFLEEARARVEEQNTAARNKADEEVDKIQYDQEAEQSVIINLQKHKLWKSGRDKFIELRNHLANNKNNYYPEKDYPSLKWEDMPLVKREIVMFGKEERHTWYKENYGKYFKYVDNNIKNIDNDITVKNNINNGLNMLYEQSKLDSFGRLLPALWKKVEKYEYLKSIWINNGWEQLEKSSELKNETYAKNLGGGGIPSQHINVNELEENKFYQFNNNELNPNTFQIQERERKHAQYLYTQNNIAFFKYNELHFLTPSINDTIFTDNLYKCRCDICNPPNRARSPSFGGRKKIPRGLEKLAEDEMYDNIGENEVLREDVEDAIEVTGVGSWEGINEESIRDGGNIDFFISGIGPGDLNGDRVEGNTDENRKLITNIQRQQRWMVINCENCENFVRFKLPQEYDINNNNSILDFLITKDWYQGGNNQGEAGTCINSSLTETTLLCPLCREDIVECAECDCECFEDDLKESPLTKNKYVCDTCYNKDINKMPPKKKRRTRKKRGGGRRKTRKKRGGEEKELQKLTFNKSDLIKNFEIKDTTDRIYLKLKNENVTILLSRGKKDDYVSLDGFYKADGIEKMGIARCALYVLLLEALERKEIKEDDIIKVTNLVGPRGEEKLLQIYKEIGFTQADKEHGYRITLTSTVKNLIETLKTQCDIIYSRVAKTKAKLLPIGSNIKDVGRRKTRKKRGGGRRRTRKKRGGVMQLKVDDLYTIQAKTLNVETSTFVWKYIDVRFDYYDEHDKAYHFTKKADGGRLKFYGYEHNDDISNNPNNGNWGDIKLMDNIEGDD